MNMFADDVTFLRKMQKEKGFRALQLGLGMVMESVMGNGIQYQHK